MKSLNFYKSISLFILLLGTTGMAHAYDTVMLNVTVKGKKIAASAFATGTDSNCSFYENYRFKGSSQKYGKYQSHTKAWTTSSYGKKTIKVNCDWRGGSKIESKVVDIKNPDQKLWTLSSSKNTRSRIWTVDGNFYDGSSQKFYLSFSNIPINGFDAEDLKSLKPNNSNYGLYQFKNLGVFSYCRYSINKREPFYRMNTLKIGTRSNQTLYSSNGIYNLSVTETSLDVDQRKYRINKNVGSTNNLYLQCKFGNKLTSLKSYPVKVEAKDNM